jgi:hypothetical protein
VTSTTLLPRTDLPLEIRAALDLVALMCVATEGSIRGSMVGGERLVDELGRYADIVPGRDWLVCLGAQANEIVPVVSTLQPDAVVTIVPGPLAGLRRLVPGTASITSTLARDLPIKAWQELGFKRESTLGIQGPGSVCWAVAERLAHFGNRPELADRGRIGMLITLVAARPLVLSAIRVHQYRRAK